MKLKRSTIVPSLLGVYLLVMAAIGYPRYASGEETPMFYFGVLAISAIVIVLLHFNLKKQERIRRQRMNDNEKERNNKA